MGKYVRTLSKSYIWGVDILILVILGTQDKVFPRLLENLEKLIENKVIKETVVVQAGMTKFESQYMEIFDFIPMDQFDGLIKKSDIIITHGGVGTILSCIRNQKKVIAVPRLSKYKEHENDHQLQIIEEFSKLGYIYSCIELEKLEQALKEIRQFKPKKYVSNNSKMIHLIENYIDNI